MLKISEVEKKSIASELKIKAGWTLVEFDGNPVVDIIDYLYYDSKEYFTMRLLDNRNREIIFEVEKDEDETLGFVFEDDGMSIKTCHNKCIFCFVDQMPKGMRETLYIKDDDYRQSFLCGNFVTLTNLTENDAERIKKYKLSPLYISVHTMNRELREKMTNNRFAGKIVDYIHDFAAAGITMHTQIVLVPGVNDGWELEYSITELFRFYPYVQTIAVVPCGITKYRQGLYEIQEPTVELCKDVIKLADKLNAYFGVNFVTLADEFYFKSNTELKSFEFFGEFPQIENGVGMTAKFAKELDDALEYKVCDKTSLILTGTSAEDFIRRSAKKVEKYCKCLKTHVIGVVNNFFGETVNCSGLLTGGDLLSACLAFKENYDEIVIPKNMLREFEEVFLDGMTVTELSQKTGKPIRVTDGTGEGFFQVLTEKIL